MDEPVLRPMAIDMTDGGERPLIVPGEPVYTLFVAKLALGTTKFEISINDVFIEINEGDTVDLGDCTPTTRGIKVRTTPNLAGLFSTVIIGGTPGTMVQRL